MSELRWNPLLGTYTMVAANRQHRPHLPTDANPFGPGNPRLPANFRVLAYPNDFPALSTAPESVEPPAHPVYHAAEAYGVCEVILYSPDENAKLYDLPLPHLRELVDLWAERSEALARDPSIRYIFPFENRGAEVGVTIHHPHGQLYAYSWVPQKLQLEHRNARAYLVENGRELFADILEAERADGRRIIFENAEWVCFLPYFTDYPYGIFLVPKRMATYLPDLDPEQRDALADALRLATGLLDQVFDRPMPYMMCLHPGAVNSPELGDPRRYFRFHIEFYPTLRSADRIKYYASSEMGAWAAANTRKVEETAEELRQALQKFKTHLENL